MENTSPIASSSSSDSMPSSSVIRPSESDSIYPWHIPANHIDRMDNPTISS
jgi:hypothetical protein